MFGYNLKGGTFFLLENIVVLVLKNTPAFNKNNKETLKIFKY